MTENKNASTICGASIWPLFPSNDTSFFVNDVFLCAVNVPFSIFAFLGNLAVVIAVIKTPSLQRPRNILLCSLAITDCLTGLVAQPLFVAWRVAVRHIHDSCDHQAELFQAYNVCKSTFVGWSLVNITLLSFDRHYALAKPLKYRASVTKKEAGLAATITGIAWLMVSILPRFIFPIPVRLVFSLFLSVSLVTLTIVNHVGIFRGIRRHNNQVIDAVSGINVSVILRREKKAAIDMLIVIAVLLLFMAPAIVVTIIKNVTLWPEPFKVLHLWSSTLIYINSSINPVIYLVRNSEIRNAVRSLFRC